jgi:putative chitinase
MLPSADILQRAGGCPRGLALTWEGPLSAACSLYEIDTMPRLAAFLAQVGHESAGFARTIEDLNYSAQGLLDTWPHRFTPELAKEMAHKADQIAEHVYGGRMGNKDPGDGYRFRGRGLLMTTGRANYEATDELLREHLSYVPNLGVLPETLAEPRWAAYAAAAFWVEHDLNRLADAGAFDKITERVNGGQNGAADRRARYVKAKAALA